MNNEKEISFGAFDSELMHQEIYIPEGFEATIEGNKIILTRIESEDERIKQKIIKLIKKSNEVGGYALHKWEADEMLAWLEKQGDIAKLWTIQDAKKGDILADKYGVYIYDQLDISDESACVSICGYQYSDKKFEPEPMICNKSDFYPATKEQRDLLFAKMKESGYEWLEETKELKKIELPDVGHEYYSELLKNDKSDTIGDYAYQCVYCMSHDWALENPTWDDVQNACKLGAKWQKKHDVSGDWSEEDEKTWKELIEEVKDQLDSVPSPDCRDKEDEKALKQLTRWSVWIKSIKERIGG